MKRYTFRSKQRLKSRRDFQRLVRTGCRMADRYLLVYAAATERGHTRLGVSVAKRIGPAVKRNRVKRLIRESFRLHQHDLPAGLDLLVVAKPNERPMLSDYRQSLLNLTRRANRSIKGPRS